MSFDFVMMLNSIFSFWSAHIIEERRLFEGGVLYGVALIRGRDLFEVQQLLE